MLVPVHPTTLDVDTIVSESVTSDTLISSELLSVLGALKLASHSPAALAASQNDYDPNGGSAANASVVYRLTPDAGGSTLTGMLPPTSAADEVRVLLNISTSAAITLSHQSASSAAANRIIAPSASNFSIPAGGGTVLWYDGATTRWRVVEAAAGLGAVVTGVHEFTGLITFSGGLATTDSADFGGVVKFSSPSSPAALSAGSTNDYDLGGALGSRNTFRVTPDAAAGSTLTGIVAAASNTYIRIYNIQTGATGNLTLAHQNAGSTAGNRIICPGEVDLVVLPGSAAHMWYDGTSLRWRVAS